MIIVVSTDDRALFNTAEKLSNDNRGTYGKCYQAWGKEKIPQLDANEDLFISAHGAFKGDDNNPVIGDKKKDHYVNAVEFYKNLKPIFPKNYKGRIFVSACEAADHTDENFSFTEVFKGQISPDHDVHVYGQRGSVGLTIPAPNDRGWVEATI